MKFLFVGVYSNQDLILKLNKLSRNDGSMSIAAIKYTRLIGQGLKYNVGNNCTNLFLVPIGMYPVCKVLLWNKGQIDGDYYIPFINIIFLKQLTIALYLFYFSIKWYFRNKGNEKRVIVFSFIYLPFLIAVAPLKFLKKLYITSFVPDMPEYEFSYTQAKFSLKFFLIPLYIFISKKVISISDYFVFITKYMIGSFPKRPYCIIEGFTDSNIIVDVNLKYSNKNALMYAGALFEKFGLRLLLDAFSEIKGNYELWLFGNGEMEREIKLYSLRDPRIIYFGNCPNDDILKFQKKAKLLVNPRFTDNEFTKYSFPSKLLEYMSSGTPVLTTKLPGIPTDYIDKMYFIDDETVIGLRNSLILYLTKTDEELHEFGKSAREYVLAEKNNYKQIELFINNLRQLHK